MNQKTRSPKKPPKIFECVIEDMSSDGRGVARVEGKVCFVTNALPGEKVRAQKVRGKRQFDEAKMLEVIEPSEFRVEAKCAAFGMCGGCALQHFDADEQIRYKLNWLLDSLRKFVAINPETVVDPVRGPEWGYRHKARLGVRYVRKKEKVLVGFREKLSSYITEMDRCEVLAPSAGEHIAELADTIRQLDARETVAQIEVAVTDDETAMVFRHLEALSEQDLARLRQYETDSGNTVFLQPGGLDTVKRLSGEDAPLYYTVDAFDIRFAFSPVDFTQINPAINQKMIATAIDWLEPGEQDNVLDLFCGIGNFSLPIATRANRVVGVEGSAQLVEKAQQNAGLNNIANAEFHAVNLMQEAIPMHWHSSKGDLDINKLLIDPPRSGAQEVIRQMDLGNVERIVYVSCHPASLARDAGILVNEPGFTLEKTTVLDMFPHTAHVESIALFTRKNG